MRSFVKKFARSAAGSQLALFAREIVANPRAMGAACPSSARLARQMASQVPVGRPGLVVELGGGTGVVTAALLTRGVAVEDLWVVERSPTLASHLRRRFPELRVIQGDAAALEDLLRDAPAPVASIVSSLPLRSMPAATVRAILGQVEDVLGDQGLFVQFTYSPRQTETNLPGRLHRVHSHTVWRNLPPARVDVFAAKTVLAPAREPAGAVVVSWGSR